MSKVPGQMLDYVCKVCNEGDYDDNNHILICEVK